MKIEWMQILFTVVPIFVMFLWLLRESRADNRALNKKMDDEFKEVQTEFKEVRKEFKEVRKELKEVKEDVLWLKFRQGFVPQGYEEENAQEK